MLASSETTRSSKEDELIDALPSTEIVVTAERAPEQAADTPASATIIDSKRIERLGEPLLPSLLRLTPSLAVATSGPAGSLTEVRIRGAENNHTLVFIDGIRVNDPATGNQPRFELLNADIASRVEVVRGPQSALWGSEAIGGVIAVNGTDPAGDDVSAASEAGSLGFRRGAASGSFVSDRARAAVAVGWQRARGIDAFDGTGDRDGYRNLSGRLRGTWRASPALEFGVAAIALTGRSEFDGFDPVTFRHADTLDSSRNRLAAGRAWAKFGAEDGGWSGQLAASVLGSRNRNFLADEEINRTSGRRSALGAQLQHRFRTASLEHRLIVALEQEREAFRASDTIYFGATDQKRERTHQALTVEWRGDAGPLAADVALRRDRFNRFEDATTVRASLLADLGRGFSLAASYGEGIAQPTFFDLYGFFPENFAGNPSLRPESSRGFEASVRYRKDRLSAALTGYRQRLHNEIVDTFDPDTFLSSTENRAGKSRRSGIEAEFGWHLADQFRVTANYSYLHATDPDPSGGSQIREARRPKHSGSVAADGQVGRISYGTSLAYTGERIDTDFDVFPFRRVHLGAYWLAGARVAYEAGNGVELFVRAANAFNERYRDAVGYRTEGRSIHAGIRFAPRG
jgi:vitamin B12 transporter